MPKKHTRSLYFDYAATTPIDHRVLQAMRPYFEDVFGNPSSLHSFGQRARAAVDSARARTAELIGASFDEIIFTGSATEANNMILKGVARKAKDHVVNPNIIISSIEHDSIREPALALKKEGVEVIQAPVDARGIIDLVKLAELINERTILVSVMYANNVIGTIEPIGEISRIIEMRRGTGIYPLFHTDGVQALQFLDMDVARLGIDAMTFSAHKIYGPKGIGALYMRGGRTAHRQLEPLLHGGGHEFNLRPGTEAVASVIGFASAMTLNASLQKKEAKRVEGLRRMLWQGIRKVSPRAEINGMSLEFSSASLPNILNVYFPGHMAHDLMMQCDLKGAAISAGAACSMGSAEASPVLLALGQNPLRAKSGVRFSLGRQTTVSEIKKLLVIFKKILLKGKIQ